MSTTTVGLMTIVRATTILSDFPPQADMLDMFSFLRSQLPVNTEDPEYDAFIRALPCVYANKAIDGWTPCAGDVCADHCLGGLHGAKANGLLKVPACVKHNGEAESHPEMHKNALSYAIYLFLLYHSTKIRARY